MQALKKVFSPGNQKDDEIMYGSDSPNSKSAAQSSEAASGPYTEGVPSGDNAPTLHTDPAGAGSEKNNHGVLRQVLNPGNDKYDEQRYGETASTTQSSTAAGTAQRDLPAAGAMSSGTDNPSRPAPASAAVSMKSGVAGPFAEHSEQADDLSAGSGTGYGENMAPGESHRDRDMALAGATTAAGIGGAGYAASRDKPSTYEPSGAHHAERSFPLGGGATSDSNRPPSSVYSDTSRNPTAAPTSTSGYNDPSSMSRNHAAGPNSTSQYIDPSTTSRSTNNEGLGHGSAGAATAAAGAAALGADGFGNHEHHGHGHNFDGDPCPPGDEPQVSGVPHHIPGPHSTLTANRLDPHVPGEFPSEDGTDPHQSYPARQTGFGSSVPGESSTRDPTDRTGTHGPGSTGVGSALPGQASSSDPTDRSGAYGPTSTGVGSSLPGQSSSRDARDPTGAYHAGETGFGSSLGQGSDAPAVPAVPERSQGHHLGRDAGAVGGLGAAGVGAYELGKDRHTPATAQPTGPSSVPSSTTAGQPSTQSAYPSQPLAERPAKEHHYDRDAAAAAGVGAYELGKDRNTPATAQPTGSGAMPSSLTATQSGYPSQPLAEQPSKGHHYGRDAAAAGGLGAAGVGAYELGKDRNDPRDLQSATSRQPEYGAGSYPTSQQPTSTGYPSTQPSGVSPSSTYDSQRAAPPGIAQSSTQQPEHHYGRDAALGGGAAAAGYGAYKMTEGAGADDTGPASKTIGPHKSNVMNILDPRVQPEPEHQKQHTTAGPWHSDTVNKMDPKVQSDPAKTPINQHGYRDAEIVGGAGAATGAAGYGAYEANRGRGETGSAGQTLGSQPASNKLHEPHNTTTADRVDPRVESDPRAAQQQQPEHHYGRDAAAVGGAGAAAYAGKEMYDEKEAKQQAKEQEKHQKELEKEHEKEAKQQQKEHEKDLKHEQKEHDKQAKADEKERAKAAEKAQKEKEKEKEKHDKEMVAAKQKHDKEAAKEQEKLDHQHAKEQEKLEKEKSKEQEKLEKAREKEAHKHEHNKLHKDPPSEDKKPSLIHRILHPHEKDETRKSVEGDRPKGLDYKDADEARHAQNMDQLEGAGIGTGAGTAGSTGIHHGIDDRGQSTEYPSHASGGEPGLGDQSALGSGVPARDQGVVTEPHTGLPMNVGKYGSGAGGTDGAEQIHGYQR